MKLIIPKEIEERIHGYVMSVETEIAGMGKVRVEDNDTIIVEEVMIYEQEVTGATADLSPQAIARWQTELVKAGGSPKNWKLWFHSHANMAAFFSARDTGTMDAQTEGDWMCSLVVNKRREREARLDMYRPFRMYMEDIDIQIGEESEPDFRIPADIIDEVLLKVKRSIPTPVPTSSYAFGYHKPHAVPESVERGGSYSKNELVAIIKTLEGQIDDMENRGLGDSHECKEIAAELVDMYFELADVETDEVVAEAIAKKARDLESVIYNLPIEL